MSDPQRRKRSWIRTLVLLFIVGCASWPLVYGLACEVSPPRTPDGHPVMPLGQVFLATLMSPALGLLVAWRFG